MAGMVRGSLGRSGGSRAAAAAATALDGASPVARAAWVAPGNTTHTHKT